MGSSPYFQTANPLRVFYDMTLSERFPECTAFDTPQRSEPWQVVRGGLLTASQVGSWIAEKNPKSLSDMAAKAKEAAICRMLGAISKCPGPEPFEVDPQGPPPSNKSLFAIWHGIRSEPAAARLFQAETGLEIEEMGFMRHLSGVAGISPDGLIKGASVGFEGKAPLPNTHVGYLREGKLPNAYKDQVHFSMAVTGAESWWFQSFCPGLPSLRILVERDDYTERTVAGIEQFALDFAKAREMMANAWDRTNENATK